ncbi:MAG: ribose-5-phosphate isomerase RpiA [Ignavibacteriaceae bacterium]
MESKKTAGEKAVEYIRESMVVGLGTGSTVAYTITLLAEKIKEGLNVTLLSTSRATTELVRSLGIKTSSLKGIKKIDLNIDGADEVDRNLNGIKGGGGALLYEKIIAYHSDRVIWVVDESKLVEKTGNFPLPVEVLPFGAELTFNKLHNMGYNPKFRFFGKNRYITDGGHYIIDLKTGPIENMEQLDQELKSVPGILETGLFYNIADEVIVGNHNTVSIIPDK